MRFNWLFCALVPGVFSVALPGYCQAKPAVPDPYANEALVFEQSETTYKMHADGTGERDVHVKLRVQSDGAAQQFGVLAFSYASAYETPVIKLVRVHKADGTTVDTPASDAVDMPTEVSREAPLYSDLKDPNTLNNAAYTLSETGLSLDVAEEASRKSIAKLEEESATITTAQVNSKAFADANLLIASWDTLGWILYREGKVDEALPMLSAAWRAGLRAEIGDHLGQVYEAMGKKDEALATYTLAAAAKTPPAPQDVRDHIRDSIARLKGSAKTADHGDATIALQNLRTYKITKPEGASGWGTFRLEITTAGVIESQKMSGEQHIEAAKPVLDAMKFPELMPPGSKAHLLRSAVVSCSMGKTCEVVLVPDASLQTERQ